MLQDIEDLTEKYKVKPFDFISGKYFYYTMSPFSANYTAFASVRYVYEYFIAIGVKPRKCKPYMKDPIIAISNNNYYWYLHKAKKVNGYPLWRCQYRTKQIAKYEKYYNK